MFKRRRRTLFAARARSSVHRQMPLRAVSERIDKACRARTAARLNDFARAGLSARNCPQTLNIFTINRLRLSVCAGAFFKHPNPGRGGGATIAIGQAIAATHRIVVRGATFRSRFTRCLGVRSSAELTRSVSAVTGCCARVPGARTTGLAGFIVAGGV
jgi:hypothetical protein